MERFKPAVVAAIGISLMLAACDEAATAATPLAAAASPQQAESAPMPSAQQKRAFAAQYDPRRPTYSMYLSPGEVLEAKGFLLQYLESPVGSAAERRGWDGYQRYQLLIQQRTAENERTAAMQEDERAVAIRRDEPEAREICSRFRRADGTLTFEEATAMHERMKELEIEYPSELSSCAVLLRFEYLRLLPRTCSAAPC